MKTLVMTLIISSALVGAAGAQEKPAAPVNAGNKICPVMGSPVSEASPVNVEYKGKIYNLCCMGCKKAFEGDPEAYVKKVEEQAALTK